MKVIIIEDEELTASDLADTIVKVNPSAEVIARLTSVKEALAYFTGDNVVPDLVFSDVQLGDGVCFEIFNKIDYSFPIIFCTAYDEYALDAFKANGIDYILKPFSQKTIIDTLAKYDNLKKNFSKAKQVYNDILDYLETKKRTKNQSVIVYYKDKILPVSLDAIALFYIDTEVVCLRTFDGKTYAVNKPLEELEKISGESFFRVSRQFLIHRKAVKEASQYFSRKLSISLTIPFDEKILIRKEKIPGFLNWLSTV